MPKTAEEKLRRFEKACAEMHARHESNREPKTAEELLGEATPEQMRAALRAVLGIVPDGALDMYDDGGRVEVLLRRDVLDKITAFLRGEGEGA